MNNKNLLLLFFVLLSSSSAFSQRYLQGNVESVIDGRTFVILSSGRQHNIQLQYVEIPEAAQELSVVVKQHLEKLLMGKPVKVEIGGVTGDKMISRVWLNNVDVSLQMLRDGAAWYNLPLKDSQSETDREIYISTENQARTEKRGVWGVDGLKPSWVYRAELKSIEDEKIKSLLEKQAADNSKNKPRITAEQRAVEASKNVQMWADVPGGASSNTPTPTEKKLKPKVRADDPDEYEYVKVNPAPVNPKYQKTMDAVEDMQDLLGRLLGTGSMSSLRSDLGNVKVKVALAADVLDVGALRILMEQNVQILTDLDKIMTILADYKGVKYSAGKEIAEKYNIPTTRTPSGDYVLTKEDIFRKMTDKALDNFVNIKRLVEKEK